MPETTKALLQKLSIVIYSYIFNTIQYSTSFNQKIGYDELNLSRPVTVSKSYEKHFFTVSSHNNCSKEDYFFGTIALINKKSRTLKW